MLDGDDKLCQSVRTVQQRRTPRTTPRLAQTKVSCLWNQPDAVLNYQAAVSLHSHTNRSKESLHFVPKFAESHPLLKWALERKVKTSTVAVNFPKAYWTPPLSPELSFTAEREQIENQLGLQALVALTDHDNIEAPLALRAEPANGEIPFAFEWSVPFENAIFHLGIHNLPSRQVHSIMADLSAYTENPASRNLAELLEMLDDLPEVLVVFNHPLWDLYGMGRQEFLGVVDRFLDNYVRYIHAFELNATRSCDENHGVIELSDRWQRLMISGGDRHGCEPSGAVNLTKSQSFGEFAHEIRVQKLSHVLFMPQYANSLLLRTIQTLLDVIREYPEFGAERRRWDDRVFHPSRSGIGDVPISTMWRGSPAFIERTFSLVRILERGAVRRALARVLPGRSDLELKSDILEFSPEEVVYETSL